MADFAPDLVGFTGLRSYQTIDAADLTPQSKTTHNLIVDTIAALLVSVGWTKLSGPTDTTNGNEYELYSAQSPWYDATNIPAWYIGGRIYLKLSHPNASNVRFSLAEYYNSTITDVTTSGFDINTTAYSAGLEMRLLGNPYELWLWSDQTIANGNGLYLGALNVPRPVQQQSKVISSLLATRWSTNTVLLGSNQYSSFRVKDASAIVNNITNPGNASPQLMNVKGFSPFGGSDSNARKIWSPTNDPGQTLPNKNKPYPLSAQVAYRIASSGTDISFNGFLWDSMILSEAFQRNSVISFINKLFICIGGNTAAGSSNPCSLFLNIGDI